MDCAKVRCATSSEVTLLARNTTITVYLSRPISEISCNVLHVECLNHYTVHTVGQEIMSILRRWRIQGRADQAVAFLCLWTLPVIRITEAYQFLDIFVQKQSFQIHEPVKLLSSTADRFRRSSVSKHHLGLRPYTSLGLGLVPQSVTPISKY